MNVVKSVPKNRLCIIAIHILRPAVQILSKRELVRPREYVVTVKTVYLCMRMRLRPWTEIAKATSFMLADADNRRTLMPAITAFQSRSIRTVTGPDKTYKMNPNGARQPP